MTVQPKSNNAKITGGTLAGVSLTGSFGGGNSRSNSSVLAVSIPDASKSNAPLVLTKGDANSVIKYVKITNGSTPNENGYTSTYTAGSTNITVANGDVIWLLVTAENGTTKLYYKITVTVQASGAGTTGWLEAGGYTNNTSVDYPENAKKEDGKYAVYNDGNDCIRYTFGSNLVPSNATITGIEVTIKAYRDSNGNRPLIVTLYDGDTIRGNSKTKTLTSENTSYTLGSSSDKWGYNSWTANMINNNFKVKVDTEGNSTRAYLDYVQVKIHYTTP